MQLNQANRLSARHALRVSCAVVCLLVLATASAAARKNFLGLEVGLIEASARNSTDTKRAKEYKIKAAFLYNFCVFTTWPKEAFKKDDSPIVVGVLGSDPFGPALDAALKKKKVDNRAFRIERYAKFKDIGDCHLLFVPSDSAKHMSDVKKKLENKHTLIVGESTSFALAGGAIGFYVEKKKMRFEVNTAETKRRGLSISSKLLKLARIVKEPK